MNPSLRFALPALLALLTPMAQAAPPFSDTAVLSQRADPHATLHSDGYYYFVATVPEYDRIELRRAKTIDTLSKANAQVIWRAHARGEMSRNIWAPELHHIDGKWYIYFTAGRSDAPFDVRLYVLENSAANPLTGKWIERGQLKTGWEIFALDATTFTHAGVRYLAWTQRAAGSKEHATNIYIAKMAGPLKLDGKATLLSRPEYKWETTGHKVNEAPAVIIRHGRVFMTYSASATDANYCLGLLSAPAGANLLDAAVWKKSPLPVFKSNPAASKFGPGHNAFTTTPDGKTDIMLYHARNYRDIKGEALLDPNRHTRARAVTWRADGTPDFGAPGQ
ncbi:glycoside hydrolase family 43 protein [Massilia sp. PAMC28688]|uniref:glycoside hydrolase family 43 protein n=1 Tax=Massilia sp. PAMC28688 TaxID=2861283 RepID=UPI001C63A547|nr:glycoside hydrolase family 43 protein [Massilia sp. PAMC28688]QYF93455.1 glycoside hydrolase family 43 protein [Massilia sp. PAMC28688]